MIGVLLDLAGPKVSQSFLEKLLGIGLNCSVDLSEHLMTITNNEIKIPRLRHDQ